MNESVTCFCCGKKVRLQNDASDPSWFGSYLNDHLVQVVCTECHRKGVQADDTLKEAHEKLYHM